MEGDPEDSWGEGVSGGVRVLVPGLVRKSVRLDRSGIDLFSYRLHFCIRLLQNARLEPSKHGVAGV